MESEPGSEFSRHVIVDNEANALIEGEGMRVPVHLDAGDAARPRQLDDIVDEGATDASSHPVGIYEEILELESAGHRSRGDESDDPVRQDGRNPDASCDE